MGSPLLYNNHATRQAIWVIVSGYRLATCGLTTFCKADWVDSHASHSGERFLRTGGWSYWGVEPRLTSVVSQSFKRRMSGYWVAGLVVRWWHAGSGAGCRWDRACYLGDGRDFDMDVDGVLGGDKSGCVIRRHWD